MALAQSLQRNSHMQSVALGYAAMGDATGAALAQAAAKMQQRARFLAQESWRLNYGQLAIQQNDDNAAQQITYTLQSGVELKLPGWSEIIHEGRLFFQAPDGQEFDEVDSPKRPSA